MEGLTIKRHWPQHLHLVIASAIFLGICVLVFQIAERANRRLDLTRSKIYSLAPETVQVLERLNQGGGEIRVNAFFAEGDPARRDLALLLKEMEIKHPRFRYVFFDPDRAPSEARRFRVDAYQTVIAEYAGRQERFLGASEEDLTNTLIRLAHPKKQVLCFTRGHGELPLIEGEERVNLSTWKRTLEEHQYEIREIQLLTDGIQEDCNVLVMAGPRYELLPREIDLLLKYEGKGKGKGFLLLVDPMDPGVGKSFIELGRALGFELGPDVVIDKVSRIFGGDYLVPLVAQYAPHPVTERFQAAVFLPIARTVRKAARVPKGTVVTELAWTHPGSWGENDLKRLEKGEADFDEKTDLKGPLPLVATAERGKTSAGARRSAVIGDSDFLSDAYLNLGGNRDFALNLIQWLAEDDRWIAVRVKAPQFEPLFLKVNESLGVAIFSIGGLPLTVLLAGGTGIFLRRRRSL